MNNADHITNSVAVSKRRQQVEADILVTLGPFTGGQKLLCSVLAATCALGLFAFIHQARRGLIVTGMGNYFSWGVYIVNFVFFIGISHAGTLVSAILRVTGAEWRRPITRMAEAITLFALIIGAPMVIIDMGRPDRVWHVLRYGRFQSPILWDVISITTYLTGSVLYLYLPMIPDMAMLRDHAGPMAPWRRNLYRRLAIGWKGTADQWHRLERAITVMSIVIIPVAVSVHTVVSWIFSMTLRPGWHSTIFGPYFVVGAIFSGIAALLSAMGIFVTLFPTLKTYVTVDHFRKMASLLLAVTLLYIYFTFSEYMTIGYTAESSDARLLDNLFRGEFALMFWTMAAVGLVIPAILLALPWTRTFRGIMVAAVLINIGMWLKRYVIVVPTLATPFMPPANGPLPHYIPTWVEWSITAGAFAGFGLLYTLFAKLFPIISVWEVLEEEHGPALLPAVAPMARMEVAL